MTSSAVARAAPLASWARVGRTCSDIRSVRTWRSARGAARALQELAGHRDLGTLQRSMYSSPAAVQSAIRLLDQPEANASFEDISETGDGAIEKVNRKKQLDGEPRRNRTLPAAFSKLLIARDLWS